VIAASREHDPGGFLTGLIRPGFGAPKTEAYGKSAEFYA
jgi:hypothetical protein